MYENKDIKNLGEWCLIGEIIKCPGITNVALAKRFNVSKTQTHSILKKLELKKVIKCCKSADKGKWREVLYYLN